MIWRLAALVCGWAACGWIGKRSKLWKSDKEKLEVVGTVVDHTEIFGGGKGRHGKL